MSNTDKTRAQQALAVLEQAYAYYTPAPYIAAKKDEEPAEYIEYAVAA